MSALDQMSDLGVSIWLDDLGRKRLRTGELKQLVNDRRVVGVTTNPSIFAAAVGDGAEYAEQLTTLASLDATPETAVRALTVADVSDACDVLAPVYEATQRVDGRVSLEVDPRLSGDTDATTREAKELWRAVNRPNLMVKIPGTQAGLPAITSALAAGVSVNVTLIFGLERYRAVTQAWLTGLEHAEANGHNIADIGSVASFFISRFDSAVDKQLDAIGTPEAKSLRGLTAVANGALAYAHFETILKDERWLALEAKGARPQRPLWASTSTKDPTFPDTKYVVEMAAPNTVNTMPPATIEATFDHGVLSQPSPVLDAEGAGRILDSLARVGVSYDDVVADLETAGVAAFEKSWLELIGAVGRALGGQTS